MKRGVTAGVLTVAASRLLVHLLVGDEYGWHRDELATLDDARYLDWGYLAYPPFTPLIARLGLELFDGSMVGVRLFSAIAQAVVVVIAGLMARELGGSKEAQIVAAIAVAIAPISMLMGVLFQYVSFDFLWWALLAWLVMRLLNTGDERWWLPIGATIGIGMMTKYTMLFFVGGLVVAFFAAGPRRHLRSRWLWAGVVLSLVIFLPNLLWQLQHDFVSLEFFSAIHERDVRIGRTEGYVLEQLFIGANLFTVPLWIAGLSFYLLMPEGKRFRMLGWMFVTTFVLFLLAEGRSYYLAPAYPMLLASGAVVWERWMSAVGGTASRLIEAALWALLVAGTTASAILMLPIHPVQSPLWKMTTEVHDNFAEQIGWEELVAEVARIHDEIPDEEKPRTGILTGNYGEAGAINLYGPEYGLPTAISGINSYWYRGYGDPPPETLIILGYSREDLDRRFERCTLAGTVTNRYGVENEESRDPEIYLCRGPLEPWHEVWPRMQYFG